MEQTIERTQQWSVPSTTSMALATTTKQSVGLVSPEATAGWAEIFRKSGLFSGEGGPEVQLAQAQVKILAGAEMGLQPVQAMQKLYIVKGHISVAAEAIGGLIQASNYAMFKTTENTADKAVIEFYRREGDKWSLVLTSTYRWEDVPAARRSNPTYTTDRADMLWNRAMSKGGRKAFPELVGGMRSVEEAYDAAGYQEVEQPLIPEDISNVAATPEPEIAAAPEPDRQSVAATSEKPKRKAKAVQPEPEADTDLKDDALENETEGFSGPEPANREKGSVLPTTKAKVNHYMAADATGLMVRKLVKAKGWQLEGTADLSEYQAQIIIAVCEGRDEADVV